MTGPIDIVYEDNWLIVVNKPNNVLVHHSYYARNIEDDSLLQLLKKGLGLTFYPINRLDRKTSGIVLLAKEKEYVSLFQELFENQKIKKIYHALVRGHVMDEMVIDSPVKNERGNYKEALSKVHPMAYYNLNIPVEPYPTSRYTLLEMTPITGRTHQLRIHANKIAHPIIGDHKYGNRHHNRMFEEKFKLPNLFLHSKSTEFIHPFTNEKIELHAQLPEFWSKCFENFETFKV